MGVLAHGSHLSTSRRGFLASALLLASTPLTAAVASGSPSWLKYGERLAARLGDAGGGSFDLEFAKALLIETNSARVSQGLSPMEWDEGLATSARAHAADMLARGFFEHQSPDGFSHVDRICILNRDLCGRTAENLAYKYHPIQSTLPNQIQALWEASPGHRDNLLNPDFREAGFGVVRIAGTVYVAGIYGDAAVRLGQALPLMLNSCRNLEVAIATATPNIDRLSVTAPRSRATWMIRLGEALPELEPGIWQLRPLRVVSESKYQVLPGPLFHLAS